MKVLYFFFFFQAEDGIRDGTVTGVQTCALPISADDLSRALPELRGGAPAQGSRDRARRSEERRVGKECRSRWSTYHSKKKKLRFTSASFSYVKKYSGRNEISFAEI